MFRNMPNVSRIHSAQQANRQPGRPQYIAEWAEHRGLSQRDVVERTNIPKSTVSRLFNKKQSPQDDTQQILADLFHCEKESLFRHPDDDWMTRFLRGRPEDEVARIKAMLEVAFPRKTGTGT